MLKNSTLCCSSHGSSHVVSSVQTPPTKNAQQQHTTWSMPEVTRNSHYTITDPRIHHPMKFLLFSKYFSKVSTRKNWTSLRADFNSHTPDSQHTSYMSVVSSQKDTHTHAQTSPQNVVGAKKSQTSTTINKLWRWKRTLMLTSGTSSMAMLPNLFQGGDADQVACSDNLPHALINFI